jgi:hypothetical protein
VNIKIKGKFEKASKEEDAIVVINRLENNNEEGGLFKVKVKYSKKVYELPLNKVAELVVMKLIKLENML